MSNTKQKRNALTVLGCLLLGGVCNQLTRTRVSILDTLMFSANFMIYRGCFAMITT